MIYERARKDEGIAEVKAEDAKKKVAMAKKALQEAKAEEDQACRELEKKIIWRKKVQKRSVLLTKNAMKEDNSDLGNISWNMVPLMLNLLKNRQTNQTTRLNARSVSNSSATSTPKLS